MKLLLKHILILLLFVYDNRNVKASNDTLIFGLSNSKLFDVSKFNDYTLNEIYKLKSTYSKNALGFFIRTESQTGLTIRPIIIDSKFINIPIVNNFYIEETENKKNILQIGENDFDNDHINEIVIAFGIRGIGLKCYILKYQGIEKNERDISLDVNWKIIGEFDYKYHDTKYASYVEKDLISFPFGSQGASDNFTFKSGKFISW
jgi:hypothetical protein